MYLLVCSSILLLGIGLSVAAPLQRHLIAENLRDPMSLAIAPDEDVYVVEREGRLLRIRPTTGGVFQIGNVPVTALRKDTPKSDAGNEEGLQGIALDPSFQKNQRIYLFYSHAEKSTDRLSRFHLRDGLLDLSSELVLIDIPVERFKRVCHHGGSVQFGPDGLLYLSVGDNTNPFESDGFAPIDNREGRTEADAQRSSGNTNDYRGKILRIRPTETGYEIPAGNLFPQGMAKTLPEIYTMGCRNPFRISIDPKNSVLYWGEVGPDGKGDGEKGPTGHDEINQAKAAGNFGWPFLVANNKPYPIVDFATGKIGAMTQPNAPENPGIRNTGLKILPAAQPALIYYPYSESKEFPAMGIGGRNAMAGPVFYYDAERKYNVLSSADDHSLITYDWMRANIWKAKLDANENLQKLEVIEKGFTHPMDLEMASDGSLMLLEYGSNWWFNTDGKLLNLRPTAYPELAQLEIEAVSGKENAFQVKASSDLDSTKTQITWWITTGATEMKLGVGSEISVIPGQGSELRAVVSDGQASRRVARISFSKQEEMPELALQLVGEPKSIGFGESVSFKINSATPPPAEQTTVRARYIPATGHDAGGPQFSSEISAIATANLCLACHQADRASVGPHYLSVALKYRDRPDAFEYLKAKLKSGSAGIWGQIPMPPQVALKEADGDVLIRAILGLADGISETKGRLIGEILLSPKGTHSSEGGEWEFSAEAPGFTPAKFRLPARSTS